MYNHSLSLSLPPFLQWSQPSSTWAFMSTASGPCPPSIWWVQASTRTFVRHQRLVSSHVTAAALWRHVYGCVFLCRWGGVWGVGRLCVWGITAASVQTGKTGRRILSNRSAQIKQVSLKSRSDIDLCYGSYLLSGQTVSLCGRNVTSAQAWQSINVLQVFRLFSFVWKRVLTSKVPRRTGMV